MIKTEYIYKDGSLTFLDKCQLKIYIYISDINEDIEEIEFSTFWIDTTLKDISNINEDIKYSV